MDGTFDINDTKLVSSDKLIFSAKGEKKRICVRDAKIAMVEVHAVLDNKQRRLKLCTRSESKSCKYCDQGFSPTRRYGLRVFEYFKEGPGIDLKLIPWVFSQDKLDALKKGLGKRTLKGSEWLLECTNSTFQAFSIKPAKECLWQKDEKLKTKAKSLSGKVKAEGVAVLRALLSPVMPVESSKKGSYSRDYESSPYGPEGRGRSPVNPSSASTESLDSVLQDLTEDLSSQQHPSQDSPQDSSQEEPEKVVEQGSGEKKIEGGEKAEEDWESSLNEILGDFE